MSLTRQAILKDRITIAALLVVLVAGIIAYLNMPRSENPGFTIRTAVVQTFFPGAAPERIEQLITDPIEKVVQEMPELDYVYSESKTGVSVVYVFIKESYTDMRPIWDDLRRKVNRASRDLPDEAIGPFVNDEFGDVFGIVITLTGEGFSYAELKEIADECRNELLLIDEAAKVNIHGAQKERIFIEYNNSRLAELNLSPTQLKRILETRNIIIPGGEIYTEHERMVLQPTGNFESVEDIRRAVIQIPGTRNLIFLEDLAHVYRGYIDPPTSVMHYMGKPSLALAVNLREDGNILELGEKVKAQVRRFQEYYPIGIEFNYVAFQPHYVEEKVNNFVINIVQAVGIVMLVMLISLGIRTGLVVASLIPMAMIMALMLMAFFDIGIDTVSLAALIISLGLLVDNAIVMSESIMVMMREGKKPLEAAEESAKELRIPLLTSSLTTAAAFLPIFLAESVTGEYTASLFKVVTITLLSSWVLALTLIPMLCVKFLKINTKSQKHSYSSKFYRFYRNSLVAGLRHPLLFLLGVIAVFFGAMALFQFVPNIFFPEDNKPIFYAEMELPVGSPLSQTTGIVTKIEDYMSAELMADSAGGKEGIVDWASFIGKGGPRYILNYSPEPESPHYAYILINATSKEIIQNSLRPKIDSFCLANFPDLSTTVRSLELGPPVEYPVEIRLFGKQTDKLFALGDSVRQILKDIPGTKNITDNWGPRAKKLMVEIDEVRARRAGLTNRDIAVSLQSILSGIETTEYYEDDKIIPVILRSVAAERDDLSKLESHNIFSPLTGRSVPLLQVANIEVVWQPAQIIRRDRLKMLALRSNVKEGYYGIDIAMEVDKWLKEKAPQWGIGYGYELGGEVESSGDANKSIAEKLPFAFLVIILLLVGQFNSARKPLIILLTIPLGLIGVVLGLLLMNSYFGFMTLLGIISLAGIVINNAIVLLERIKLEIDENGHEPPRAIVEAGQRRFRPILLTTMTTIGGLLPLWFGSSPMFVPLAIAIIFGLLFATFLTLGVVPLLYSIFYRVKFKNFEYPD